MAAFAPSRLRMALNSRDSAVSEVSTVTFSSSACDRAWGKVAAWCERLLGCLVSLTAGDSFEAIRSIVEEGEGTPTGGGSSHYARFTRLAEELQAAIDDDPAFDSASLPGPIHSESSSPTRTLPPIAAAIAAICIWLRPAPSTDQ